MNFKQYIQEHKMISESAEPFKKDYRNKWVTDEDELRKWLKEKGFTAEKDKQFKSPKQFQDLNVYVGFPDGMHLGSKFSIAIGQGDNPYGSQFKKEHFPINAKTKDVIEKISQGKIANSIVTKVGLEVKAKKHYASDKTTAGQTLGKYNGKY